MKVFFDHEILSLQSYENIFHVHFIKQLHQDISKNTTQLYKLKV